MLKIITSTLLIFFTVTFLPSCMTPAKHPTLNLMSESDYFDIVRKNSDLKQIYDGFLAVLEVRGTLLTSNVSKAQLDQRARLSQWSAEQYTSEKTKSDEALKKETKMFLSFFTPDRKHDDLNKSKTTWKLFLDVAGKRYEGKATRMKAILAEVNSLYPDHNRWGTPYVVSFPVPTATVDLNRTTVTLTGPVTATTLDFSLDKSN